VLLWGQLKAAAEEAAEGCCRGSSRRLLQRKLSEDVLQREQSKAAAEGAVEGCCCGSSRRVLLSFASQSIIIF
jgi:hypothetical protein